MNRGNYYLAYEGSLTEVMERTRKSPAFTGNMLREVRLALALIIRRGARRFFPSSINCSTLIWEGWEGWEFIQRSSHGSLILRNSLIVTDPVELQSNCRNCSM
jgi:hypothetical protein